jgi:inner membrane protein
MWAGAGGRIFLPWRPIPVAPIGLGLLSDEGLAVFAWEALVFAPLLAFGLWRRARLRRSRSLGTALALERPLAAYDRDSSSAENNGAQV